MESLAVVLSASKSILHIMRALYGACTDDCTVQCQSLMTVVEVCATLMLLRYMLIRRHIRMQTTARMQATVNMQNLNAEFHSC